MADMHNLYERLKRKPHIGDRAVTQFGCFRTVLDVRRSCLNTSIKSDCSNPKTCPKGGACDLTQATIERGK